MNAELEPHIQEAIARFKRQEEAKDIEMGVHLEQCLLRMRNNFRAATPEEVEQWEREQIIENMKALGWDERACTRIAPNWNCPQQEKVFQFMTETLKGNGSIIALVGERGVGKTTLAAEHSRLRLEAQKSFFSVDEKERPSPHAPPSPGRYEKLGRLSNVFKPLYADFGSINGDQLAAMLETWCERQLVVIDELHETEDLKTNMRFLADFVDRRYANHKDTILISNHSPEEFKEHMNTSIVSRINHHGAIIRCNWQSHRR
jgi:DNA replication protein DnaC